MTDSERFQFAPSNFRPAALGAWIRRARMKDPADPNVATVERIAGSLLRKSSDPNHPLRLKNIDQSP